MQSDWTRGFWLISQKSNFSRIWDLCRILANINFHYRPNSDEINDYFFNTFLKSCFWPIFGFLRRNFATKKSGFAMHNFTWVSNTMAKFRKNEWSPTAFEKNWYFSLMNFRGPSKFFEKTTLFNYHKAVA